ncbi:MAG: hypothetical protein HY852_15985 [Bradyrhizobium sp.]|uniref:hypothetical protein n=1 Tax=Bradyrhizobium sp. TaxID=376 RepID=UPI0025BC1BB9|nr:hypothetical protein [Bradyrhizobium sp.]MBI5263309.1 hypothetical protein [Bradyrhizobium sp.]
MARIYGVALKRVTIQSNGDVAGSVTPENADDALLATEQDDKTKAECEIALSIMPEHGDSRVAPHKWFAPLSG